MHERLAQKCNKGAWIVDSIVNLIMGSSTTLDVYVIVRLVVLCMALELFSVGCAMLGGIKGR